MTNLDVNDCWDSEERLEIDVEFVWKPKIDALSSVNKHNQTISILFQKEEFQKKINTNHQDVCI